MTYLEKKTAPPPVYLNGVVVAHAQGPNQAFGDEVVASFQRGFQASSGVWLVQVKLVYL